MNKKGALELSITAVVVLIIAITLLGFAIYFIKTMMGGAVETFTGEFGQIKAELRENMEQQGETIGFKPLEPVVKAGKATEFWIGMKNDYPSADDSRSVCYGVQMKCRVPFSRDDRAITECAGADGEGTVGGISPSSGIFVESGWFSGFPVFDIEDNTFAIEPSMLKVPNRVPRGTYQMELNAWVDENFQECQPDGTGNFATYDPPTFSKRFRIKVE